MADFFDKVKQGINRGVTTVSVKSREVLDTTMLKSQIDTLNKQKKEALEALGNVVYTLFVQKVADENRVRAGCEAVAKIDNKIRESEEELRQTRIRSDKILGRPTPVAVCRCGNDIYEGTKFCSKCGQKVELAQKVGIVKKNCPQCGVPFLEDTKFCHNCGERIEDIWQETEESRPEEKVCPQCGANLSVTALFCRKCGTRLP